MTLNLPKKYQSWFQLPIAWEIPFTLGNFITYISYLFFQDKIFSFMWMKSHIDLSIGAQLKRWWGCTRSPSAVFSFSFCIWWLRMMVFMSYFHSDPAFRYMDTPPSALALLNAVLFLLIPEQLYWWDSACSPYIFL